MKPVTVDFFIWNKESKTFSQEISTLEANGFTPNISTYFEEWVVKNPVTGTEVTFSRQRSKRYQYIPGGSNNQPGTYIDSEGEPLFWVYEPIGVFENQNLKNITLTIYND